MEMDSEDPWLEDTYEFLDEGIDVAVALNKVGLLTLPSEWSTSTTTNNGEEGGESQIIVKENGHRRDIEELTNPINDLQMEENLKKVEHAIIHDEDAKTITNDQVVKKKHHVPPVVPKRHSTLQNNNKTGKRSATLPLSTTPPKLPKRRTKSMKQNDNMESPNKVHIPPWKRVTMPTTLYNEIHSETEIRYRERDHFEHSDDDSTLVVQLKREITLLNKLVKKEKTERLQVEQQNAELKDENDLLKDKLGDTMQAYENFRKQRQRDMERMKEKLNKHTNSSEYEKFVTAEVMYEKLLEQEKSIQSKLQEKRETLAMLIEEITSRKTEIEYIYRKIMEGRKQLENLQEAKHLDQTPMKNLNTGLVSTLLDHNKQNPRKRRIKSQILSSKFPTRVLIHMLHFLPVKSILAFCSTCFQFYGLSQLDSLWVPLIERDLSILRRTPYGQLPGVRMLYHVHQYSGFSKIKYIILRNQLPPSFFKALIEQPIYCFAYGVKGKYRVSVQKYLRIPQHDYVVKQKKLYGRHAYNPSMKIPRFTHCVIITHYEGDRTMNAIFWPIDEHQIREKCKLILTLSDISKHAHRCLISRTRKAYLCDTFTDMSDEVFNQQEREVNRANQQQLAQMIVKWIKEHIEQATNTSLSISGAGKYRYFITQYEQHAKNLDRVLSEGQLQLVFSVDGMLTEYTISGQLVDQYMVDDDSVSLPSYQKTLHHRQEPHEIHTILNIRLNDIEDYDVHESLHQNIYSLRMCPYIINGQSQLRYRKYYIAHRTKKSSFIFLYRNRFKSKDFAHHLPDFKPKNVETTTTPPPNVN